MAADRVVRQPQAVARPRLDRRWDGPGQHRGERVAGAGGVADPQRRPPARVLCPHAPLLARTVLADLAEEPVGLRDTVEAVVGLAEPVPGLAEQVALGAGTSRALQRLGGFLELAALKARATALQ